MLRIILAPFALLAILAALTGCGNSGQDTRTPTPESIQGGQSAATQEPTQISSITLTTSGTTLEISSVGDSLEFDKTDLSAKAGEQVTIRLINGSTALQHNWVLVKQGSANEVAQAGITAGASNNWVPTDDGQVYAFVNVTNPGESDQATFRVPKPGIYQFVCTFPGHDLTMTGTFESLAY